MAGSAPLTVPSLIDRWRHLSEQLTAADLRHAVADDLSHSAVTKATILEYLASLQGTDYDNVLCRSVDTTTHLKLSLATTSHRGFRIWLHVYKPWSAGESRYAASVHNHRYAFVSKILSGGYIEQSWAVHHGRLRGSSPHEYRAGDVVEVDADDVHSLEQVMPATMTFIAQLPAQRSYSVVYPRSGESPIRLHDLESKVERLLTEGGTAVHRVR